MSVVKARAGAVFIPGGKMTKKLVPLFYHVRTTDVFMPRFVVEIDTAHVAEFHGLSVVLVDR